MPKEVIPQHDLMTSYSANPGDMTQPMGPLEEGDQALVDAAHTLPEGEHSMEGADGSHTRITKIEGHGRTQVVAKTTAPEPVRSVEQTIVKIDSAVPGTKGITASVSESGGGRYTNDTYVSGNEAGDIVNVHPDRQQAQAIKLDAANRISAATQRWAEQRVDDSELARKN